MSKTEENSDKLSLLIQSDVLSILLKDRSTGKNIIWATDDYSENGSGYCFNNQIQIELISGEYSSLIKPRIEKDKEAQAQRSKDKAEVFTPSWVCNVQNNLIDKEYLGRKFNTEYVNGWEYEGKSKDVKFPTSTGVTWEQYVKSARLEISCGEAPYLASRYDSVTGDKIKVKNRIGLLDRKLRVISTYVDEPKEWILWAKEALKSTYGFEWQGDNIIIARKNLLYTVIEFYFDKFDKEIEKEDILELAEIISWNIWQMDGIKFVIPESCTDDILEIQTFFGTQTVKISCPGCEKNNNYLHNGTYANIMNWKENKVERFIDSVKVEVKNV